jgi:hypothetical protein
VLLGFNHPINLISFAVTLDNDPFGVDGTQPGFEDVAVVFLDAQGFPLAAIRVNQTQPGFQASRGPLDGVAGVVLPAGAFYDNLSWAPVPEPGSWALVAGVGVLGFGLCRRLTSRGCR